MTKTPCPLCKGKTIYEGLSEIECVTFGCANGPKTAPASDVDLDELSLYLRGEQFEWPFMGTVSRTPAERARLLQGDWYGYEDDPAKVKIKNISPVPLHVDFSACPRKWSFDYKEQESEACRLGREVHSKIETYLKAADFRIESFVHDEMIVYVNGDKVPVDVAVDMVTAEVLKILKDYVR